VFLIFTTFTTGSTKAIHPSGLLYQNPQVSHSIPWGLRQCARRNVW